MQQTEHYNTLAAYNLWANEITINWLKQITNTQFEQNVESSFPTIKGTVLHIAAAESIWLDRLQQKENPVWIAKDYTGTKEDLQQLWLETSINLKAFIAAQTETFWEKSISFKRINGEASAMRHNDICTHIFNHSIYHRGQLVTMLRQVGYTNITSTDFITYIRLQQ